MSKIYLIHSNLDYSTGISIKRSLSDVMQTVVDDFNLVDEVNDGLAVGTHEFWKRVVDHYRSGGWAGYDIYLMDTDAMTIEEIQWGRTDFKVPEQSPKRFVVMRCPECGSHEMVGDGAVRWSIEKQDWELSSVYDHRCTCDDCGEENWPDAHDVGTGEKLEWSFEANDWVTELQYSIEQAQRRRENDELKAEIAEREQEHEALIEAKIYSTLMASKDDDWPVRVEQ